MNVNNSGSSLVIDPKSQAAIDIVRDRITLLESENTRLTKLKAVLDDSVRKAEAELAYKTELLEEIDKKTIVAVALLEGTITSEAEVQARVDTLKATEEQIKRDLDEQADAIIDREKVVREQELDLATQQAEIARRSEALVLEENELDNKKEALAALLTKL